MAKPTIVRTWIGGLIGVAGGVLLAGLSVGLMLAYGGTFSPAPDGNGYDFVPSKDAFFWTTVAGIVTGGVIATVGGLVQLVAWIGALINTNLLADKTWVAVLAIGGVIGLAFPFIGFVTMVVYLIAGPDGYAVRPQSDRDPRAQPSAVVPAS